MDLLFSPYKIGNVEFKNRFAHSATCESMAEVTGEVTDGIVRRYSRLARGQVGMIITGHMYVHPHGRAFKRQVGIHSDEMLPGLKELTDAVHSEDGKIIFQLSHAGMFTRESLVGVRTISATSRRRALMNSMKKPRQMTEADIYNTIRDFRNAAKRAVRAGADGIQLHGAHNYLISQFLSPFFNNRKDRWGGTDENRFRFLKEIVLSIKEILPDGIPLLIKIDGNDFTPLRGITPGLATKYAKWLQDISIDAIEVSCGSVGYNVMSCRGDIPIDEMLKGMWPANDFILRLAKKLMARKHSFSEGYNLDAARMIKLVLNETALITVGGLRRVSHMEKTIKSKDADFISMSRPFIRDPFLVKRIKEGKTDASSCASCNKCLVDIFNDRPVRCRYDK